MDLRADAVQQWTVFFWRKTEGTPNQPNPANQTTRQNKQENPD
jgi:hypothetical protein